MNPLESTGSILTGQVELHASATHPISSVEFELSPEEPNGIPTDPSEGRWTKLDGEVHLQSETSAFTFFNVGALTIPDGLYKLRALVTDHAGEVCASAPVEDQLIANHSAAVGLAIYTGATTDALEHEAHASPPHAIESGQTLMQYLELESNVLSVPPETAGMPAEAAFQWWSPGEDEWRTIEKVKADSFPLYASSELQRQTTFMKNGFYDFRVVAATPGGSFVSSPVRRLLVDNKPPTASMIGLYRGARLQGKVTLEANATDPESAPGVTGSGVKEVIFERARADVAKLDWRQLGSATVPSGATYRQVLNTDALANGQYDFRVVAIDQAGNEAASPAVEGVEVANPALEQAASMAVSTVAAPAHRITMLGTVAAADSPDHETETWAYGFTSGPPAEAEGTRLEYTAEGNQLVLLRYTAREGWQIREMLRDPRAECGHPSKPPGECAFKLVAPEPVPGARSEYQVLGSMTASGEAWLLLHEKEAEYIEPESGALVGGSNHFDVFRREPGGRFEYDENATKTLGSFAETPLEGGATQLRVMSTADHQTVGMLIPPQSHPTQVTVQGERRAERIKVQAAMGYALLTSGEWTLKGTREELEEDKEDLMPPYKLLKEGDTVELRKGDVTGAGERWGALAVTEAGSRQRLVLAHADGGEWTFFQRTGLDALDRTGALEQSGASISPTALKANAEGNAVWLGARVAVPQEGVNEVVARLNGSSGLVENSWCTLPVANECEAPGGAARVPEASFPEPAGEVAVGLAPGAVDVFANGAWSSVPAPGFGGDGGAREVAFSAAEDGWLGGENALGHFSTLAASSALAPWPVPDHFTLTSVALPPLQQAGADESGGIAVGLDGAALSYNASTGWLTQPVPPLARSLNLTSVAFAGPSSAFAVGQFGLILRWDGTAWSEDPQSRSLTSFALNGVAFAPSGQGWAVGADGVILHYNGQAWSQESAPARVAGESITSVAVAGSEVFAVAGGELITLGPHGWKLVESPPLPPAGSPLALEQLRLVAGLPDGGVVAAGRSLLLVRERPGQSFQYAGQPIGGTAVALAPFREPDGSLRAFVSVAPPAFQAAEVGGFPPGDGELLRETDNGWQDLSGSQFAGSQAEGDGAVKTDPVLAVAASPGGEHAWAVGGYAGTVDAAAQGTAEPLATRPSGWQTAAIWRYDSGGSPAPPNLTASAPNLPAKTGTVSFAFFSGTLCKFKCSAAVDAQPDVNLASAAKQMDSYASQSGGPAFAMLGGDARGQLEESQTGVPGAGERTAADFAQLPELLASFQNLPLFAALGPRDDIPTTGQQDPALQEDPTLPWAEAFAEAPPPFGSGQAATGITPTSSPQESLAGNGAVHRYYSFDVHQNGGTVRMIVLNNAKGSLEEGAADRDPPAGCPEQPTSSPQTQLMWLTEQLCNADKAALAVVVVAARPLARRVTGGQAANDGEAVASLLAEHGVLAVFTGAPPQTELDEHHLIPEAPSPGGHQIPEYEGASLGYQQAGNNGVLWYLVSVDAPGREVNVSAVPVIDSLTLKPLDGLSVARSLTLQFEAVGRRPAGTLATKKGEAFPGYENYVSIPAPGCGARPCVPPDYSFTSSSPTIGDFVEASAPGSPYPRLDPSGHPIPSSRSGLFCAYNSGTTTVSVTAGLLSYSQPVTVRPGGVGQPCGTVADAARTPSIVDVPAQRRQSANPGAGAPPPPATAPPSSGALPNGVPVPPPASQAPPQTSPPPPAPPPQATPAPIVPPPAPSPAPPPLSPRPLAPSPPLAEVPPPLLNETATVPPAIVPTPTPPVEPIPPGASGYAQSPSAAERREKARKHASQSAFSMRELASRSQAATPVAASSGSEPTWFYWTLGLTTLLALTVSARSLPARPRPRAAAARALPESRKDRSRAASGGRDHRLGRGSRPSG